MSEDRGYVISLEMDHLQLVCFYTALANAHKNWPGGEPYEQEILKGLRDECWKLLLEAQFEG
jgi:hypothetical protein